VVRWQHNFFWALSLGDVKAVKLCGLSHARHNGMLRRTCVQHRTGTEQRLASMSFQLFPEHFRGAHDWHVEWIFEVRESVNPGSAD
jgi:hypothetical protein